MSIRDLPVVNPRQFATVVCLDARHSPFLKWTLILMEMPVARKTKAKTTDAVGLIGLGLDNQDEHKRVTTGEEFLLVGGSQETHERMQDVAIHVTEALKDK